MLQPSEIFRASALDEFRRYQSGETFTGDEYTAEAFVSHLTDRQETAKMAAGTAVHRALEIAGFGELSESEQFGWKIDFLLDADLALPTLREIPMSREHNGVTLFGRVDSITGSTVRDIKTTERIDADRYAESYQWRAYLWMSGRNRFIYDVLTVKIDEDKRTVVVSDHVPLVFNRYPALDREVEALLDEYAAAVRSLGLLEKTV